MNISGFGQDSRFAYYSVSDSMDAKSTEKDSKALRIGQQRMNEKQENATKTQKQDVQKKEEMQKSLLEKVQDKLKSTYDGLSDRAKEYLKNLQEKNKDMDFYVADAKSDSEAQQIMSQGTKSYSVLIDPDTIEKMAADEETASKYESMIQDSKELLTNMKDELTEAGVNIKSVGMSIDEEGKATYYGIVDESLSYYEKELEKQEEKKAKKAELRKEEARKEEKKEEARKEELKEEARKEELKEERLKDMEDQKKAHEEFMKEQLGSQFAMVSAGTIDELKAKLHQKEDTVLQLKKSTIPAGTGIDLSV